MVKHGASHGLAYLVSTVAAGLVIMLIGRLTPKALEWMTSKAAPIAELAGPDILSAEEVSIIALASVLCVVWGMAFKRLKKDT